MGDGGRKRRGPAGRGRWRALAAALLLAVAVVDAARAQAPVSPPPVSPPPVTLPTVEIVATTPLLGSGIDRDKVPAATQSFTDTDLRRDGPASTLRTLGDRAGGVTLQDAQGNPLQPNLVYRGFQASPLVGNAQGLAVYVNGGRFNQPFGDTVNWDLIPDIAIARMNLVGSNPAFGLNALGGALAVELKNGFTYQGNELELSGGSFGRIQGSLQSGRQAGDVAIYVAATGLGESGWRDFSPSQQRQLFGDIGWRRDGDELHLNLAVADNDLTGNGTTPIELLAVSRSAVFTYPDETRNKSLRLTLSGSHEIDDVTSLQANLYYQNLDQRTRNGDAAPIAPCSANGAVLCATGGGPLTDRTGGAIPNFVTASPYAALFSQFAAGGPYAVLNQTATDTNGYGVSLQATNLSELAGRPNHLVVGGSVDGGATTFSASTALGALSLDRGFIGPGVVIDQADGSITPVRVETRNTYYGLFAADTLDVTSALSATLSGRLNVATIDLQDQLGTALTGDHTYARFNPAAGLTYKLAPAATAYVGYAEANRAPTPAELSCASPQAPCSLTNFFVGDPNLKQVVARTIELGLRGQAAAPDGIQLGWHAGLFRTDSDDDIAFVASPTIGRDFFENIGTTRRQGVEAGIRLGVGRFRGFADYTYTDASYRSALTVDGGANPQADPNGLLQVRPGNQLPGVPQHVLKLGVEVDLTPGWTVSLTGRAASGQYLMGDPSNLNAKTGAYAVLNLSTTYHVTEQLELFGLIQNLTDANYATFGTFSPVGSDVPIVQAPNASNPRSLSPGAPLGVFGGLRVAF